MSLGACRDRHGRREGRPPPTADSADVLGTDQAVLDSALGGTDPGLIVGRPIHPYANIIAEIHSRAPNARILIAGYPRLFGSSIDDYVAADSPGGANCVVHPLYAWIDYADAQWLNTKAGELNDAILAAVNQAKLENIPVDFVPAALFAGLGLCDNQEPWLNPAVLDPSLNPMSESFHPTATGYGFYAETFALVLAQ